MPLLQLPPELLEPIITFATPEAFESLALSCKALYALCKPSITRHNALKAQLGRFAYGHVGLPSAVGISSAFQLLAYLIDHPLAARYIRHADLSHDSRRIQLTEWPYNTDAVEEYLDALEKETGESPYSKQTSLDHEAYNIAMRDDIVARQYSQYAATLLLTFLPNLESVTLPKRWRPVEATDQIVSRLVERATLSHGSATALSSLDTFGNCTSIVPRESFQLDWARPFLALPNIKKFLGQGIIDGETTSKADVQATSIETIDLTGSCLEHNTIGILLQHSPHLRSFRYSHATKDQGRSKDWDVCKFVTTIADQVGGQLQDLSVTLHRNVFYGRILPGTASLLAFKSLEVLELPLEIAACNRKAEPNRSVLEQLVPPSVRELSFVLQPSIDHEDHIDHENTLEALFQDLHETVQRLGMKLKTVHLTCPDESSETHRDQFTMLRREMTRADVQLHTHPFPQPFKTMV